MTFILNDSFDSFRFASQAKTVKNKPQKNGDVSHALLLTRYTKQLINLQGELQVCIVNRNLIKLNSFYHDYLTL